MQWTENPRVGGSIPPLATNPFLIAKMLFFFLPDGMTAATKPASTVYVDAVDARFAPLAGT